MDDETQILSIPEKVFEVSLTVKVQLLDIETCDDISPEEIQAVLNNSPTLIKEHLEEDLEEMHALIIENTNHELWFKVIPKGGN